MGKMKEKLIEAQEMLEAGYSVDDVYCFTGLPYDYILELYEMINGPLDLTENDIA